MTKIESEREREEMFTEREIERITFGGMNVGEKSGERKRERERERE